ncbi:amidohydrolase [Pseudovibrio sp. Tun.PSC04-5.I4]|uniref:amidohydrolase n=1 Tax=Pseudovibrio sp. Tun.PSC04-5.I4 TaxID=1798213 RepID=UPI001FCB3427|nr:amidohydrolase [Pseudovibrio sp. Tun.PSC04-5.I4]
MENLSKITDETKEGMVAWRHHIHRNPETGFDVHKTAHYVAGLLAGWGIEVHTKVGVSGVVGVLKKGDSEKSIALRADLDALPIQEMNQFEHRSCVDSKMHGCGHDGHTAMLLGAAQHLAKHGDFDGTVYFIFQPDEEYGKGALCMIKDGLFERFPAQEIYGMHNVPGLGLGKITLRQGGTMASETLFEINIVGKGGHASSPHRINDPVVIAAQVIQSLQTIVSRSVDPLDAVVVSVTEVITDGARNVVPTNISIKGDYRTFSDENVALVKRRMEELATGICAASNAVGEVKTSTEFLVTFNAEEQTKVATAAAIATVGAENVETNCAPKSFSEDFAHLQRQAPGCYVFIGNGTEGQYANMLHNPEYDFNDQALQVGASYWVELAEQRLTK